MMARTNTSAKNPFETGISAPGVKLYTNKKTTTTVQAKLLMD
jgi:hypothetical protein